MTDKLLDLALDLDQTLIHAYEMPEASKNPKKVKIYEEHELFLCKFKENEKIYYIYSRPGLFQFLHKVYKKYNIYIYTYGAKDYAHHIIGHICGKLKCMLFKKIYTRDDFENYKKKLLGCNNETNTVIVDDNPEYWPGYKENLLKIEPFYGPFYSTSHDDELERILKELNKTLEIYENCEVIDIGDCVFSYIDTDSETISDTEI